MVTKIALALAVVIGTASFSAYAQSPRPTNWNASRIHNSDYAFAQRRDRIPMQARDGTANYGNETTAAGGVGRVNSHQQD